MPQSGTSVHQLLLFNQLALCLASSELTGSAFEKAMTRVTETEAQEKDEGKSTEVAMKCL